MISSNYRPVKLKFLAPNLNANAFNAYWIVFLVLNGVIRYFLTLFLMGVAIIAKFMSRSWWPKCGDVKIREGRYLVDFLQCYHSSLMKFEDQNCLSWPGYVLTMEDDLVQFWCGNMFKLSNVNPKSCYLVDGLEMDYCAWFLYMYAFRI